MCLGRRRRLCKAQNSEQLDLPAPASCEGRTARCGEGRRPESPQTQSFLFTETSVHRHSGSTGSHADTRSHRKPQTLMSTGCGARRGTAKTNPSRSLRQRRPQPGAFAVLPRRVEQLLPRAWPRPPCRARRTPQRETPGSVASWGEEGAVEGREEGAGRALCPRSRSLHCSRRVDEPRSRAGNGGRVASDVGPAGKGAG